MQALLKLCKDLTPPQEAIRCADAAALAAVLRAIVDTCTAVHIERTNEAEERVKLSLDDRRVILRYADVMLTALVTHYDVLKNRLQLNLHNYSSSAGSDGYTQTMLVMVARWNLLFIAYDLDTELDQELMMWKIYTDVRYGANADGNDLVSCGLAAIRNKWSQWKLSDLLRQSDVISAHRYNVTILTPVPTLDHSGVNGNHALDSPLGQLLNVLELRAALFYIQSNTSEMLDMKRDPFTTGNTAFLCDRLMMFDENEEINEDDDDDDDETINPHPYVLSVETIADLCHTWIECYRSAFIHVHFKPDLAPPTLPDALLCGAREWFEVQALSCCDSIFREELTKTMTHLSLRPGQQHWVGRRRARVLTNDETAIQMDTKTTTQIMWMRNLCANDAIVQLLSVHRPDVRNTMLLKIYDKCMLRCSALEWRRNAVVFEVDFYRSLRNMHVLPTPVIFLHGELYSLMFNQRVQHFSDCVQALVAMTHHIVNTLNTKFILPTQNYDLGFMRGWMQEWLRMGEVYLKYNPYGHKGYVSNCKVRESCSEWFRKHWSTLSGEKRTRERLKELPVGFSLVIPRG